jgi:serine/threonine protein kinase
VSHILQIANRLIIAVAVAVEEYVGKGDIFNDCISHPEKYNERHVATALVQPLLKALAYLHANNILHRYVGA